MVFFALRGLVVKTPLGARGPDFSVVFSREHQLYGGIWSERFDFALGPPRSLGWVCPRSGRGS